MNRIINRDILPRISKISKNNKEKDLLSIAYITWLIFIIFALGVVTVNDLKPMFNQLIVNLLNIYYYMEAFILGMDSYLQYNLPYSFDFWSIFVEAINLFVKVFLIAFIPSVIRKVLDFLRNKIWYNSSMNYEASKQLTDVRFKRLVGVQRTTFEEMLAVLKTAYQRKHAKGGRTPKLSLEDLLMATLQYMREYRTYEQIAADFGIHESNLIRRSQWVESTLIQSGFTISKTHLSAEDTVIVDATEVKINRPKKIN
ncbi:hypothetical protein SAG0319_00645 [Streptococcus agalactiae GB00241]|nr:hypothetical protein SAG0319_00645 [Streptococcus agalactiae GB00241]